MTLFIINIYNISTRRVSRKFKITVEFLINMKAYLGKFGRFFMIKHPIVNILSQGMCG